MYIAAISAPAANTARGKVRQGSFTSALIAETSSSPVNANAICDQKYRKIKNSVNPIVPAGDKAVKIAEGFFSPNVQPAFFRETRREFINDHGGRHKKEQRSNHPQANRRRAVVGGCGNPSRPKHGSNVEQQHIPKSHFLAQLRYGIGGVGRAWGRARDR